MGFMDYLRICVIYLFYKNVSEKLLTSKRLYG